MMKGENQRAWEDEKKTSLQGYRAQFPGVVVCPLPKSKTSDLTAVLWDHS